MTTLTVSIDDAAAEKVRRAASERRVTVDSVVQDLIETLEVQGQEAGQHARQALKDSFRLVSTPMGGKPRQDRDELYDR